MTFVLVVAIGAGALLISSALDNTPLVTTFQKILSGAALDFSGNHPVSQGQVLNTPIPTIPSSGTPGGKPTV
jgi:Na+/H+ antiporter NhaD/arsenite permease-like protein